MLPVPLSLKGGGGTLPSLGLRNENTLPLSSSWDHSGKQIQFWGSCFLFKMYVCMYVCVYLCI